MDASRTRSRPRRLAAIATAVALTAACGSDGGDAPEGSGGSPWPSANLDLSNSRAVTGSPIDSSTVDQLEVAWTFEVPGGGIAGALATTPVVVDGVVWLSDLGSNVYALDLDDGSEVLTIRNDASTFGPNGVAVGGGRVFVAPDSESIAAYDASSGEQLWRNVVTERNGGAVNIQPQLADGVVLVATSSLARPGSRGTLFALDAETGEERWSFDTIDSPDLWGNPEVNSGGGSWYPPAVDLETRRVYWGTANPYPWPGTPDFPNGSSRPGDNRWTDSTLALDLDSGELVWGVQHRPHDLFDLDSSLTALVTVDGRQVVIGSGKLGRIVGMDPATGEILFDTPVGVHENDDLQELTEATTVYPGYVGGVTTPIAVADGVVYAAAVNAPSDLPNPAIDFRPESPNFTIRPGQMVAVSASDGSIVWDVEVDGQPFGAATVVNDLLFGATLTGELFALDRATGEPRWSTQLATGVNGWPAVAGDTIVVPAGVTTGETAPQVVAYRLAEG